MPPLYAGANVLSRSPCSLNFSNLCDNFVEKLISELRKCRQLTSDQVVSPCTQWGLAPSSHKCGAPFRSSGSASASRFLPSDV